MVEKRKGRKVAKAKHGTHVEHLALFRRRDPERDVDEPSALVVEDVGADLADQLGGAVAVEVVVLDLEVLAEREEDVERRLVRGRVGDAREVHRKRDGEVE